MTRTTSASTQSCYPVAALCRVWKFPRATLYRHRSVDTTPARPARRRGPQGACSDAELLAKIEAVIEASPFNGEGYRKVWARLRADGVRTAMRRVRRIMGENSLLASQRPVDREEHPHDGTIMTDRVDQMWGTDMTQTVTTVEGRAYTSCNP
jgi:putative transposase